MPFHHKQDGINLAYTIHSSHIRGLTMSLKVFLVLSINKTYKGYQNFLSQFLQLIKILFYDIFCGFYIPILLFFGFLWGVSFLKYDGKLRMYFCLHFSYWVSERQGYTYVLYFEYSCEINAHTSIHNSWFEERLSQG